MSYLNPPYKNNFQELCASMPLFYLEVLEMRAILRAQGRLLDGVCGGMEKLVDVNFILTADEATIRMWEKALKITYTNKLTLDQRKHVVIGYIIGHGHIGEPEIRKIIALYTDFAVDIAFDRGDISITLDGCGSIPAYANLLETFAKRIPAHLSLRLTMNVRSPAPAVLCVGSAMGANTALGMPEGRDEFDFQTVLHPAEMMGAQSTAGVTEERDTFAFSSEVRAGASPVGEQTWIPVPEDVSAPDRVSILRTGGVVTMIAPPIFPNEEE